MGAIKDTIVRGVRQVIPAGYVVGRLTGKGQAQLIKITDLTTKGGGQAIGKASDTKFGLVKVDGTTIVSVGGVISAVGSGGSGYPPGTVPVVVQVAHATSSTAATFANTPTPGNLLVAMTVNSTGNTAQSGWTKVVDNTTGTDWGNVCVKVAGASESKTQQAMPTSTSGGVVIYELQNAGGGFVTGGSQSEQTGLSTTVPVLLPNIINCISLSFVGVITNTITAGFNVGTQDVLDNTGNRKLLAGHMDLSIAPGCGLFAKLSAASSSKSCSVLISS